MQTEKDLQRLDIAFSTLYDKKYGKIFLLKEQPIIICELTADYVPIENFRKIFGKIGEYIAQYKVKKFIFDKRNLQTFHQPSMEWYFLEWKKEMMELGMTVHRKILPDKDAWFKEAVMAGRAKIMNDHPNHVVHQLDIQYRNSIAEAIES